MRAIPIIVLFLIIFIHSYSIESKANLIPFKFKCDTILTNDNVYEIVSIGNDSAWKEYDEPQENRDYFIIERIDKNIYENQKANAVQFILFDSTLHRKQEGIIELSCSQKNVKISDSLADDENRTEYAYIGQIKLLNAYMVLGLYYENYAYILFDKTTGQQTINFGELPFISPIKKYIVTLRANPYTDNAEVELYKLSGSENIKHLITLSFCNWMPDEGKFIFWSKDGYLYVPVNHPNNYWLKNGNLNSEFEYIRIKVK